MRLELLPLSLLASVALVSAQSASSDLPKTVALTKCHPHGDQLFCHLPDGSEIEVAVKDASVTELTLTGCHKHGANELFCNVPGGGEVEIPIAAVSEEDHDHDHEDDHEHDHEEETATDSSSSSGKNCHFHAGIEHCEDDDEEATPASCAGVKRDYNIPLRIGALFTVLITSFIFVFIPIILQQYTRLLPSSIVFIGIKQFGTGVIISTAFIHLLTHAQLYLANKCLGKLQYEASAGAICMGGIFLSFLVEYIGNRFIASRARAEQSSTSTIAASESDSDPESGHSHGHAHVHAHEHEHAHAHPEKVAPPTLDQTGCGVTPLTTHHTPANDRLSVMVMESGIIFHSILIGVTLMVAGDSVFTTLFVVIIFHQGFEGLALGARIAALPSPETSASMKYMLASAFAIITPIGMAIGLGSLNKFNGNDPATIWAIAVLDALSAGILVYVGCVEMLAHDWVWGELREAPMKRVLVAGTCLFAGAALMSLLGKWA